MVAARAELRERQADLPPRVPHVMPPCKELVT